MHVLQYIAVKANDTDEAMQIVESKLTSELGSEHSSGAWFDWFVVGGGRFVEGNAYESSPNHIISFAESREKFSEKIHEAVANRVAEFNNIRKYYEDKNIDLQEKLDSYAGHTQYDFSLYDLKSLIDMLQGTWNSNSYFFDIENDSTEISYMEKTLGDSWYLVPVDFHF